MQINSTLLMKLFNTFFILFFPFARLDSDLTFIDGYGRRTVFGGDGFDWIKSEHLAIVKEKSYIGFLTIMLRFELLIRRECVLGLGFEFGLIINCCGFIGRVCAF